MTEPLILTLDYLGVGVFNGHLTSALVTVEQQPITNFSVDGQTVRGRFDCGIHWTYVEFTLDLARPFKGAFTQLMLQHAITTNSFDLVGSRPYLDRVVHSAGWFETCYKLENPKPGHHCVGDIPLEQLQVWQILSRIKELEMRIFYRCLQRLSEGA